MDIDHDVIVIGAGGAGLAAALTAADAGARVLLVEAAERVGGSTALSGGVFYAAGTSVQRARGITDDTPAKMAHYYLTLNQYKVEPAMVRRLCDAAAGALEWLIAQGVNFPPANLYAAGLDGVLRGHRAEGMGAEIAAVLDGLASNHLGITIASRARAEALLRDASGNIAGVRIAGDDYPAPCAVICSGGFGANSELLGRLYPSVAQYGDWVRYIGAPTNRGDGLLMGEAAGAALAGFDRGATLLTPNFTNDFEPYLPAWLVFVNHAGVRFMDESLDYSVATGIVMQQDRGECFAVFDESAREAARQNIVSADAKRVYAYSSWSGELLHQMAEQGRIWRADTLQTLGQAAGINPAALATTAAQLNADVARGEDTQFFKAPSWLRPIHTPPFYAVRLRPSVVGTTHAGLRCDPEAHVLGQDACPMPGLFAAGETVGNVLGERYAGGGNAIASAITFGRIAGQNAAAFARTRSSEA